MVSLKLIRQPDQLGHCAIDLKWIPSCLQNIGCHSPNTRVILFINIFTFFKTRYQEFRLCNVKYLKYESLNILEPSGPVGGLYMYCFICTFFTTATATTTTTTISNNNNNNNVYNSFFCVKIIQGLALLLSILPNHK